ncbi:MAG: hypothetical protein H7Z16_06645 [Pyrinomonadaceae bacterium]|nr:hypothetical protein [Pyrinomonadaceae bacterium]
MKRQLTIVVLALAATVTLAQDPNFDGRRGGGSVQFPRHEPSSSGRDSQRTNNSERYDTYAIAEPANPLPGLANQYRSLRGWFRSDVFPDAPSVVEPTNISELFRALVYLKDFADGRLRNLRSRKNELDERHRNLQAQIANNSDVGASLYREASLIEGEVQGLYRQTRETEERLASQNSLLNQLTAITKQLSDEVVSAKDDMFAVLFDAARRGKLLSPSNYRALPKPLSPVYSQNGMQSQATAINPITVTPIYPTASLVAAQAVRAMPVIVPLRAQPIRVTPVSEGEVQQKLNEINNSLPLINQAYQDVNEAFRRVNQLEQSASASEYSVRQSRERLESLRSQNSNAASALSSARAKLADATAAYQSQRENLPVQLFEHAVVEYYSDKVKKFITTNFPDVQVVEEAKTVNTEMLGRFAKVMSNVVELGADTLKVIERVPGALADSVEDPAALQTALDDVVDRFNVNLFSDMTGVPKPLVKYFQKRKIP